MSLYILAAILIALGLALSIKTDGTDFRAAWAALLILSGLAFAIVRTLVDLWRLL